MADAIHRKLCAPRWTDGLELTTGLIRWGGASLRTELLAVHTVPWMRSFVLAFLVAGSAQAIQLEPADAPGTTPRRGLSSRVMTAVAFDAADIPAVANEVLGQTLRLRFSIDPAVTGKVSFRHSQRTDRVALLAAFEQALALVDVALVRHRDQYLVVPRGKAKDLATTQVVSSAEIAVAPGYQALAVPLRNSLPSQVGKALQANGLGDAVVGAEDRGGRIVVAGTSRELRAALEIVRQSDKPRLDASLSRNYALRNAAAAQVADELQRLLTGFDVSGVTVVPLPRLNQLVIGARSPQQLAEIEAWIGRLDAPASEEGTSVWRYKPRNLTAASLAEALTQLSANPEGQGITTRSAGGELAKTGDAAAPVSAGTGVGGVGPLIDKDLRVGVEKDSNTLLVSASASRWKPLRALLEELDVAPGQVMIEATVLEVTLNRTFRMGVDWSIVGGGRWSALSSRAANGSVAPTLPGVAISYVGGDVRAVVDALSTKTHVNVVSAPKLLALDNRPAVLQVGDQVPIVNQTSRGTGAGDAPIVTVTEYRDTGVILKIKPRINGDDSVTLDFSQEVSGVVKNTVSGVDSPTIQQRRFESQILLREGQTAALGGLMSSATTRGGSGIPVLSDLPGVGGLFGARRNDGDRTEIIVLLTARIVRSPEDGERVLSGLKEQLPGVDGHAGARP